MRYETNFEYRCYNTGGDLIQTEFSCEETFLSGLAATHAAGETFDYFCEEVANEIGGVLLSVNDLCGDEDGEFTDEDFTDERGFFVSGDDPNWSVGVRNGLGMNEGLAYATGVNVVGAMTDVLTGLWCAENRRFGGVAA